MKAYKALSTLEWIRAIKPSAIVDVPQWAGIEDCIHGEIQNVNGEYVLVKLDNGVVIEVYRGELVNFYGWAAGSQASMFEDYTQP